MEGTTKGGQSKFENKVGWARFYLAKAGLIDTEQRGVWVLTEKGREANLTHEEAYELFREIHDGFPRGAKVIFQCKRYKGSVPPSDVRNFRGSMTGGIKHGIFLTTGTFTKGAKEAAGGDDEKTIELVDIDRLHDLLVEEGLGVRETKALEIDRTFFKPYQKKVEHFEFASGLLPESVQPKHDIY